MTPSRRRFLGRVGQGMLAATLGPALAMDLHLHPRAALARREPLDFGALEALVALLQETSADHLARVLVPRLKSGLSLRSLAAAGALANARTFGGHDYVGYHAFMAIKPAFDLAKEMPSELAALPLLKVLHRSSARIQACGGRSKERLRRIEASPAETNGLRARVRARDLPGAEGIFAASVTEDRGRAWEGLHDVVRDDVDVHRIVLPWRAWDMIGITGEEHAHTLLRQSLRFCVEREGQRVQRGTPVPGVRTTVPRLMEEHGLARRVLGKRDPGDAAVETLARTVFTASRDDAAAAVAAALAEGIDPEVVGEALSIAANLLVLYDPGRRQAEGADKPRGSVHGASVGVHAQDSANAWRNVARVGSVGHRCASLLTGAWHTAGQHDRVSRKRFPLADLGELGADAGRKGEGLLTLTDQAVRSGDQARAVALVERYHEREGAAEPLFALLRAHAVSEDGALHAEKYYWTVREEFATTRPAFRWRHLVALARVSASAHGRPAPGLEDARRRLLG